MQMANRHMKICFSINNHQRIANQNHNEIVVLSPHSCQNGYHQKRTQITNIGEGMEKREPLYTVFGNVSFQNVATLENTMEVSQNTKNRTTV